MIKFESVAHAIDDISQTSATSLKEALLKKYADIPGFKEVLQYIYDPYFTTGIKQAKLNNSTYSVLTGIDITAEQIMDYLKVHNTGDSQAVYYATIFIESYAYDEAAYRLATGIVTKDLQIGVSVTTLNKIFGKAFIPRIGIMRGMLCPEHINSIYIATEKIDGNRRIIMNKETGVEIYTRSGKPDHGLVDIEHEVATKLPKGFVYDTECIAMGDFEDNIALRQASASILNRRNQKRTGVKALCFDMLPIDEYAEGKSKIAAFGRKAMLAGLFGDLSAICVMQTWFMENTEEAKLHIGNSVNALFYRYLPVETEHITSLPILGIVTSKNAAIKLAEPIWESGGEGVMLVEYRSPYEVNPNPRPTLLKIKASLEFTLPCIGVYEGANKYENMLGGIYVGYTKNGRTWTVGVGSGFTDYERELYWDDSSKIIGKNVELECFGESQNMSGGYSLNCPIFKRVAGTKE